MNILNSKIEIYGASGSKYIDKISLGCQLCIEGKKSVLYITGRCEVGCYYCTISSDRKFKDSIYINEQKIDDITTEEGRILLLTEIEKSLSHGVGITGGDPLSIPDRTIFVIKLLKDTFGKDFHIHLYTSGHYFSPEIIQKLVHNGLDELRVHPKEIDIPIVWKKTAEIKQSYPELTVGFEIPAIPEKYESLIELIKFAENNGIDFVNLNEFEFTEQNFGKLTDKTFLPMLNTAGVQGSAQIVTQIFTDHITEFPIHYCASASKDNIQLLQRFKRRASQVARPFESVSDEGELEYGRIYTSSDKLVKVISYLEKICGVPSSFFAVIENTIESSWQLVEDVIGELREQFGDLKAEIICQHPIANGPITYVQPL